VPTLLPKLKFHYHRFLFYITTFILSGENCMIVPLLLSCKKRYFWRMEELCKWVESEVTSHSMIMPDFLHMLVTVRMYLGYFIAVNHFKSHHQYFENSSYEPFSAICWHISKILEVLWQLHIDKMPSHVSLIPCKSYFYAGSCKLSIDNWMFCLASTAIWQKLLELEKENINIHYFGFTSSKVFKNPRYAGCRKFWQCYSLKVLSNKTLYS
jgi:hypothetical protein